MSRLDITALYISPTQIMVKCPGCVKGFHVFGNGKDLTHRTEHRDVYCCDTYRDCTIHITAETKFVKKFPKNKSKFRNSPRKFPKL